MNNVAVLEPPGIPSTQTEAIRIAEISAKQLKQAIKPLEKVSKVVFNQVPIIEISVFWRTLALTAVNKQHLFSTQIDLDTECEEEISFTVPTEILVKVAKSLKNQDRVIIQKQGEKIHFINGVNFMAEVSKVALLEVEEFQKNQIQASCKSTGWKNALETTLIAASEYKTRYNLDVIRIVSLEGEIKAISTDGHRMAISNLKNVLEQDRWFEVSLQKTVAELMVPLLEDETEVSINVGDKSITIQFWNNQKDVWFCSESVLAPDNYPLWRNLIPNPQQQAVFNKQELETALTKMSKLAQNQLHNVDFHFHDDGRLELKILNEENNQETNVFLHTKEGYINGEFHYDYRYILEYLKVLDEEDLVFQQGSKPCILSGPSGNSQYILMQISKHEEEPTPEESPTSAQAESNQP